MSEQSNKRARGGDDDNTRDKAEEEVGGGGGVRPPISGRTGALVMRSVSIFLASGRKASSTLGSSSRARQRSGSSASAGRRKGRMPAGERRGTATMKSAAQHAKIVEALKKKTKFAKQELEMLCKIYGKLTSCSSEDRSGPSSSSSSSSCNGTPVVALQTVEGIDRTIFRELLHNTFDVLTEDALIERMFACWDKHSEGAIRLESWIIGLDVFLRGSLRDKMEFCFRVYDLNGDGFITKDEIFQLFKNSLMKQPGEEDPEEGVRDLSEMALKKLDADHDGKVSFADYVATVREEPLMLEAFGQVLPTPESAAAFLLTLKPNT